MMREGRRGARVTIAPHHGDDVGEHSRHCGKSARRMQREEQELVDELRPSTEGR
jgi:hypothetical protein